MPELCNSYQSCAHACDLVCFLSIIPLANIFEWGGEQLAMYLEPRLGDLVVISLGKYVLLAHNLLTSIR